MKLLQGMKMLVLAGVIGTTTGGVAAEAQPKAKPATPLLKPDIEVPGLPRVLIIGDSISIGYTPFVKEAFKGKANIIHAPGNNESTVTGLKYFDRWLGAQPWDVIHFNFGLHDVKYIDQQTKLTDVTAGKQWVPIADYEKNLGELVQRLKKTGARLVWCSTTPIPEGARGRVPGDEVRYNAVAKEIMQSEGVPINDLHAFVGTPKHRRALGGLDKDVHYNTAGSRALAGEVVKAIENALASSKKTTP